MQQSKIRGSISQSMPQNWKIATADSFLKVIMGQSPSSEFYNTDKNGLPFYQGVSDFGVQYPKPRIWCSNPQKIANENQLLFSVRAPVGEINITKEQCCIGRGLAALIPINSNLLYCFYLLSHFKNRFSSYSQGTTFEAINKDEIGRVKLPFTTNIKEQEKIASIISKTDELMYKVDQIIRESQILRKVLSKKLLNKGINHTQYKETDLGEIPEKWEVKNLGEYVDIMSGEYFAYAEFTTQGIPVLKIDNVSYGNIDWKTRTFLPENYLKSHNHLVLKQGDIVLALNRPITNDEVKVAKVAADDSPSILYQRVGLFKFKTKDLDNQFFFMYLCSSIFKKLLSKALIGSDQPYVKTTELKRKKVAFPGLEEQKTISQILTNITDDIKAKQKYKSNLDVLKKGLMQSLLTGKMRVKI